MSGISFFSNVEHDFFLLSWQQWSLSNGSFFCWSLTLLINFGQISYGEIGRSLKSCINAHITGKKSASDVGCSVSPLLTDAREEWWCESGVVLGVCFKQRPKENVTVDTNPFGTLQPPAFFHITACTLLCGKANILLVISQLFYVQERAWLVTKITRWEDTVTRVASLQELFLVSCSRSGCRSIRNISLFLTVINNWFCIIQKQGSTP